MEDARVLEEAPDDRAHADVLRELRHARAQRAHAAHHEVDLHARLRGLVERLDHLRLEEGVHLRGDARRPAGLGGARAGIDGLQDARVQREGRAPHVAQLGRLAEPGELLEDLVHVGADRLAAGEEVEVGVEAGGARVVVAGAQVHVAHQAALLAADHHGHLGVGLVADDAVDHVGAHLLQPRGPVDVGLLVEARHELDHHRHFLAVARGVDQRLHDHRVGPGAVHGLLDRHHQRILRGLADQLDHRREGLERPVQQHVALADGLEEVASLGERLGQALREGRVLEVGPVHLLGDVDAGARG